MADRSDDTSKEKSSRQSSEPRVQEAETGASKNFADFKAGDLLSERMPQAKSEQMPAERSPDKDSILPKIEIEYKTEKKALDSAELIETLPQVFAKLDKDKSGQLSKRDILDAILKPENDLNDKEQQALVSLFHNFKHIKDLDGGTPSYAENKISREDLRKLEELRKDSESEYDSALGIYSYANVNKRIFDKKGIIRLEKIESELKDPFLAESSKKDLETLKLEFDKLKGSDNGISLQELKQNYERVLGSQDRKLLGDLAYASSYSIKQAKPAPVDSLEFKAVAESVFDKLDANQTGQLDIETVGRAVSDKSFSGAEAQVLAAMYKNFSELKELDRQLPSHMENMLSKADIARFAELEAIQQKDLERARNLRDWAKQSKFFAKADTLNLNQIERELKRKDLSVKDKASLSEMKETYQSLVREPKSGIKLSDLESRVDSFYDSEHGKLSVSISASARAVFEAQQEKRGLRLFGSENEIESIKAGNVIQRGVGNCTFMSSLAAVANTNPELIRDMIVDNKDGSYTVKFPGWKYDYKVEGPTQAEAGLYSLTGQHGIWVGVLEKAYGKFFNAEGKNVKPLQEYTDNRGSKLALEFLSGKEPQLVKFKDKSKEEILELLDKAFLQEKKYPLTAGISKGNDDVEASVDGFARNHEYTVLDFKRDKEKIAVLTIRNPNDDGSKGTKGTITVDFATFWRNFEDITTVQFPPKAAELARVP